MAIGLARMFGFEFLENFNFPYSANSMKDFWRRWHISLSTFFRDYVYKPLGGNRVSVWATYRNLLFVFFLTGLWHGASWNFIIWGLFHGLFLVIERLGFDTLLQRIPIWFRHVYTLLIVMVGWVFFRVENLEDCWNLLQKMCYLLPSNSGIYSVGYFMHFKTWLTLLVAILFIFPVHERYFSSFAHKAYWVYDVVYAGLFILSLWFLSASTYNPFIYYRF